MANITLDHPYHWAIHWLQIKLWEWEKIKDKVNADIMLNGPDGSNTQYYKNAVESIAEFKLAIMVLEKMSVPDIVKSNDENKD